MKQGQSSSLAGSGDAGPEGSANAMPDTVLCPNCGELTPAGNAFCERCQAPLAAVATLDPMKRIQTTGFVLRQAARHRVGLVGLVLTWLVFVPIVLVPLLRLRQHPELVTRLWTPALAWLVAGVLAAAR